MVAVELAARAIDPADLFLAGVFAFDFDVEPASCRYMN